MDNIGNQVPISRVGDDSRAGITAAMTFQMTVVTTECAPPFQAGAVLVLKNLVHEPLDVGVCGPSAFKSVDREADIALQDYRRHLAPNEADARGGVVSVPVRELLFEDMGHHPIVDLTFDEIGLGKQPRHYFIEEFGIVVALAVVDERDIQVEKVPGSEAFLILGNWTDVIWFDPGSRKKEKTTFYWHRAQAGEQAVAVLGEGELLVFYADGSEIFEFQPGIDVLDISLSGEDVLLHFAYQRQFSRGTARDGFRPI